jgi:hypothetical protein
LEGSSGVGASHRQSTTASVKGDWHGVAAAMERLDIRDVDMLDDFLSGGPALLGSRRHFLGCDLGYDETSPARCEDRLTSPNSRGAGGAQARVTHILDPGRSDESGPTPLLYKLFSYCGEDLMNPPGGYRWIRNPAAAPQDSLDFLCPTCAELSGR